MLGRLARAVRAPVVVIFTALDVLEIILLGVIMLVGVIVLGGEWLRGL